MRELRECRCKRCRKSSPYRQRAIRNAKRKLRHKTKNLINGLVDLEDFSKIIIGVGYTD